MEKQIYNGNVQNIISILNISKISIKTKIHE